MARKISASFNLETDDAKQNLEELKRASTEFGDEGVKVAQKLENSAGNIERGYANIFKKLDEGKAITARDLQAMVQQFNIFRDSIEQAFGSLTKAPVEVQRAFELASTQVDRATRVVRESTDAAADHKNKLNEAGASWTGFGGSIDQVFPKLGTMIAGFTGISAAFGAGLAAGQKFNAFVKTDMSEWDRVVGDLGAKAKIIITALSDELVAFSLLLTTVFEPGEGWVENVKKAFTEYQDAAKETGRKLMDLDGEVRKGEKSMRDMAEATKAAAEANKELHASITKLETAKAGSTKAISDELFAITQLLPKSAQHNVQLTMRAGILGELLGKTDGLSRAERDRIQTIIDLVKKGDELTESQKKQIEKLSWLTIVGAEATEQKKAQAKATGDLAKSHSDLADQQARVIGATADATQAGRIYTFWKAEDEQVNKKKEESLDDLLKSLSNEQIAYQTVGKALGDLKTAQVAWTDSAKGMKPDADAAAESMRRIAEQTREIVTNFEDIVRNAPAVAAALEAVSNAGMSSDAGGEMLD